jgi:hypothetical protein
MQSSVYALYLSVLAHVLLRLHLVTRLEVRRVSPPSTVGMFLWLSKATPDWVS